MIGEVDLFAAPVLVYDNAIYIHESRQYHVEHLDWEERRAYVKPVDVDYYTQALLAVTLKPLETFAEAPVPVAERAHGEVMVSSIATLYKKLRLETHENLGWGKIHLPEIELHTTAYWVALGLRFRLMAPRRPGHGALRRRAGDADSCERPFDVRSARHRAWSPRCAHLTQRSRSSTCTTRCRAGWALRPRLFDRHAELVAGALGLVEACSARKDVRLASDHGSTRTVVQSQWRASS